MNLKNQIYQTSKRLDRDFDDHDIGVIYSKNGIVHVLVLSNQIKPIIGTEFELQKKLARSGARAVEANSIAGKCLLLAHGIELI